MLALLLYGIQMADVEISVMAVQVWNLWVLRQRKWRLGWLECSPSYTYRLDKAFHPTDCWLNVARLI